jgi:hypothetical protein
VLNFPRAGLAHLGVARAYLEQGDAAKAKAAYQDFLALRKDADPDIPILKEAKARYAKLQWRFCNLPPRYSRGTSSRFQLWAY